MIDLEGSRPTTYDFLQGGYCNDEDVAAATVKWARPKILGAPAPAAKWVEFFMIEEDKSFERTGSSFSIDSSDFDPVTDADKLCTSGGSKSGAKSEPQKAFPVEYKEREND